MPRGYPGSTPGVDPRSQGVIPRRFKQKKIFVTDALTDRWTDRRDGRNSYLDGMKDTYLVSSNFQMKFLILVQCAYLPRLVHL